MNSIDFPGANATFKPSSLLNEKELRAYLHSDVIRVTAWKLTQDELQEVIQNGIIYHMEVVPYSNAFPSIKLTVDNPVPTFQTLQFPIINEKIPKKDA